MSLSFTVGRGLRPLLDILPPPWPAAPGAPAVPGAQAGALLTPLGGGQATTMGEPQGEGGTQGAGGRRGSDMGFRGAAVREARPDSSGEPEDEAQGPGRAAGNQACA